MSAGMPHEPQPSLLSAVLQLAARKPGLYESLPEQSLRAGLRSALRTKRRLLSAGRGKQRRADCYPRQRERIA